MIPCDNCKGNGYKEFLGRITNCIVCKGVGEVAVCDQFVLSPDAVLAFRNQRCHNCGVRQNDHNVSEVKA